MSDRCEFSDLPQDQCAHCVTAAKRYFDAMYDGTCVTCHQAIKVGQRIRETAVGEYEHAGHRP